MALDAIDLQAEREGMARLKLASMRRKTRFVLELSNTDQGKYLRQPYRTARGSGTRPAGRPASGGFAA